jgi:hypothetical protein
LTPSLLNKQIELYNSIRVIVSLESFITTPKQQSRRRRRRWWCLL